MRRVLLVMNFPHALTARLTRLLWLVCLGWVAGAATGCHGGEGTQAGMDMGQADGLPSVSDCPGVSLKLDGVLDVNLRSLNVSGAVTRNGTTLPDAPAARGSILFVDKRTRTTATYDLGTTGAGRYSLILAPGTYDVLFVPNPSLCQNMANLLPCSGGKLKSDFLLSTTGNLDLDLQTVVVQGRVTVNGAAIPAASVSSGSLAFQSTDQAAAVTSAAGSNTGLGTYRLVLLKGSYDVRLQAPATCTLANPVPCSSGTIKSGASLVADGTLDLDIPAVQINGTARVNGQPVASTDYKYGTLLFQLRGGGLTSTEVTNPGSGLAPYNLKLLSGTYDVLYEPRNNDCTPGVPCIAGALKKGHVLQSSGTLDLDIPLITVQGNTTINAQPVIAANETGSLEFRNPDGGVVLRKLGTYRATLLPGSYQISYAAAMGCTAQSKAPCIGGPLKKDLALQTSGALDLDIPTIDVNGRITVNGSAASGAAAGRGRLVFELSAGAKLSTPDLNPYTLRLLPGSYQVGYAFAGPSCQPGEMVPCSSGVLKPNLSLSQSGTLDVEIPVIRISGRVTLDDMPLPTIPGTRGQLQFISTPGSSAFLTPNFGSSGPVSYAVTLLPGAYVIAHQSDFTQCTTAAGNTPCIGQIVAGCM